MFTYYDTCLYDADSKTTIKITEDGDGLNMVNVKADNNYFGAINFSMTTKQAEAFANGILKQVEFIKRKENK